MPSEVIQGFQKGLAEQKGPPENRSYLTPYLHPHLNGLSM